MTASPYVDDDGNIVVAEPSGSGLLPDSLLPPQLAGLPRRKGLPVQWIAGWSGEFPLAVRYDDRAGAWALFNEGPDFTGEPLTGKDFGCHTVRGREAALYGICRGCGRPISGGASWSAVDHDYQYGQCNGAPPVTMWEPGACWSCLQFAGRYCPRMAQLKASGGKLIAMHRYVPYIRLLVFEQPPESDGSGPDLEKECVRRGGVVAAPWSLLTEWSEWDAAEVFRSPVEPYDPPRVQAYTPSLPAPFTDEELATLNEGEGPSNVGLHDLRFPGVYLFWREWRSGRPAGAPLKPLQLYQRAGLQD